MTYPHHRRSIPGSTRLWWAWLLCLFSFATVPGAIAAGDPAQGPGGPILVVTSSGSTYSNYFSEILRTEGFNSFVVADVATVSPASLAAYDVVILAKMTLTPTQVTTFTNWVNGGGNLIAMAPDPQLAGLLGISVAGTTLSNAYLLVDTSKSPGNGIVGQTIQFHGSADRYNLNGATSLATLYSNATTPTTNPALTLRNAGSGKAATFAFDLAASIVQTRQGNPAWAAQERDGYAPIRSNDKFYGNATGDPQGDWIDLDKVAIPQADEQQRLLANLILLMNSNKTPLPRFWYFPNGKKAVVIMTGDDHGNGGTAGRFDQFKAASTPGCSVANWECVRGTSYIYTSTPLSNATAAQYAADGFEIGLHVSSNCANYTQASLDSNYTQQLQQWSAKYSSLPAPATQRHHCIVWSDWSTGAEVQFNHGMRLDTSYYFWPPSWVGNKPGMFNGSAMPMRFTKPDGSLIDVYMAASQMTDESGQTYPFTVDTLLDRALGPEGYYGAYTINAHTDVDQIPESDAVIASAKARAVPVVSAQQMLTWLDARNDSSFGAFSWNGTALTFNVTRSASANGLQAMLPLRAGANKLLASLARGAASVVYTVSAIKGIEYAVFAADSGTYTATYANDSTAPQVTATTPSAGSTGVSATAKPTATFSEAIDPSTIGVATFELRNSANALISATVNYDASTRTATLTPTSALTASTTYTATLRGGATDPRIKDLAGNPLAANVAWTFTVGSIGATCPCGGWSGSAVPANPSVTDPNAVELGVKFRSDIDGFITGVRFYKGSGNTGTHVGNLWTAAGGLLARATFTGETASGWQQVNFDSPVAITANTVYVASYFAPNGHYAGDQNYFGSGGVDNPPIHLLRDGVSGGNGVYSYNAATTFPVATYRSTNYWVDVVFDTVAPADTTPPTVSAKSPAEGATGVVVSSVVTATFNEAMDAASIGSTSFELRNQTSGALVSATVSYNAASRVAMLTPSSTLAASTTYTATVRGGGSDPRVKDAAGNPMASNVSWSFTTAAAPSCPCTIWPATALPSTANAADTGAVNLGVKFRSDVNGFITGIRFYKGTNNTGTHVGTLWTSSGTQLASATFTGESASGWQQVNFASPVAITANTVYIASYFAPNGRYSVDSNYFGSSGVDNPPLRALQNGVSGGNGVYAYGSTPAFPNSSWQSANYWVDVVLSTTDTTPPTIASRTPASGATGVPPTSTVTVTFSEAMDAATINTGTIELRNPSNALITGTVSYNANTLVATLTPSASLAALTTYSATVRGGTTDPRVKDLAGNALVANSSWSFTTGTVDTTPPTITARTPANGATGVATASALTVTFSEAMDASTINTSTIELRNPANALVAASIGYDPATRVATLTPNAALTISTTYTATVRGGTADPRVKDLAGNALASNSSWSFTTAANNCPCTIWPSSAVPALVTDADTASVNLGVKFRSDINGFITGIRFYKGPSNTGTHVGTLWTSTGTQLASATFTGETASGWQQVTFASPVAITANTVYVASYHAPNGRYSSSTGYFTGSGVSNPPLNALQNGVSGGNGVYVYGSSPAFPTSTWQSANYWIDVVFAP